MWPLVVVGSVATEGTEGMGVEDSSSSSCSSPEEGLGVIGIKG